MRQLERERESGNLPLNEIPLVPLTEPPFLKAAAMAAWAEENSSSAAPLLVVRDFVRVEVFASNDDATDPCGASNTY